MELQDFSVEKMFSKGNIILPVAALQEEQVVQVSEPVPPGGDQHWNVRHQDKDEDQHCVHLVALHLLLDVSRVQGVVEKVLFTTKDD